MIFLPLYFANKVLYVFLIFCMHATHSPIVSTFILSHSSLMECNYKALVLYASPACCYFLSLISECSSCGIEQAEFHLMLT
jgi:hypothetical protein